MAYLLKVDGVKEQVQPNNQKFFQLEELQKLVDGYIEIIQVGEQYMVLNDEGKFSKKLNLCATVLAKEKKAIDLFDYIAGDVLICNNKEIN